MDPLNISEEETAELRTLARATKDAKTAIRIRVILALANGNSARHVAELFLLDEDTVIKWRKKYLKRRLFSDWLATDNTGYAGKLTAQQEREVEQYVTAELVTDCKQLVEFIQNTYDINYTVDGVTKLLHRLGFVYKQTTLIPGGLDEVAQAAWLKGYEELRDNLPKNEIIVFGDGVHPEHNVHAAKAWVKKGQDKQVPTNTGRKRLNINGALDITSMTATVHYAETLNAETTVEFLKKLAGAYPDKDQIHLIVDNARYYKNKDVAAYLARDGCRIKLIWLPAYSPNLNFIERLWHFLKKYIIGTKRRQTFKEFEADITTFFDNFGDYRERLRQFIGTQLHLIELNG